MTFTPVCDPREIRTLGCLRYPLNLPPTSATFSELRRQTAIKGMSQNPEFQDSATSDKRSELPFWWRWGSRTIRLLFICVRRCPPASTFSALSSLVVLPASVCVRRHWCQNWCQDIGRCSRSSARSSASTLARSRTSSSPGAVSTP